jgi:hypothetical protein
VHGLPYEIESVKVFDIPTERFYPVSKLTLLGKSGMLSEIIERVNNLTEEQQKDVLAYLRAFPPTSKRKYPRKQTQLPIDVVVGERAIRADTRDMSADGVFINSGEEFNKGLNIRVAFSIPGQEEPFKLKGVVLRVEPLGIAIQFMDMTPDSRKLLNDSIFKTFPEFPGSIDDKIFFRIEIAK